MRGCYVAKAPSAVLPGYICSCQAGPCRQALCDRESGLQTATHASIFRGSANLVPGIRGDGARRLLRILVSRVGTPGQAVAAAELRHGASRRSALRVQTVSSATSSREPGRRRCPTTRQWRCRGRRQCIPLGGKPRPRLPVCVRAPRRLLARFRGKNLRSVAAGVSLPLASRAGTPIYEPLVVRGGAPCEVPTTAPVSFPQRGLSVFGGVALGADVLDHPAFESHRLRASRCP